MILDEQHLKLRKRIRRLRQEAKMSQKEVGQSTGVSRGTVMRIESTKRIAINDMAVDRVCTFLGIDFNQGLRECTIRRRPVGETQASSGYRAPAEVVAGASSAGCVA